jgi:hypothetical protein
MPREVIKPRGDCESQNHFILENEPAFAGFLEVRTLLSTVQTLGCGQCPQARPEAGLGRPPSCGFQSRSGRRGGGADIRDFTSAAAVTKVTGRLFLEEQRGPRRPAIVLVIPERWCTGSNRRNKMKSSNENPIELTTKELDMASGGRQVASPTTGPYNPFPRPTFPGPTFPTSPIRY